MVDFEEERYYLKLAAEARQNAQRINDPYSKRAILLIAQRYDNLAARAAEKVAIREEPKSA